MKKIILTLFFAISGIFLFAQNKRDTTNIRPLNNFNLNILGEASLISINYERLFLINPRFFLTCRLGIGYNFKFVLFNTSPPENYMIISQHITGNLGKGKRFFEFGLSGAIVNKHYLLGPLVGLRIQPLKSNKVNLRLYGILPVIGPLRDMDILYIPVGLSLGVSF
jgi:hypothetical protein